MFLLRRTLEADGYPPRFIDRHSRIEPSAMHYGPEKKPIFLNVSFLGDSVSAMLKRRIRLASCSAFSAAEPKVIFRTSDLGLRSLKDKIPFARASNVIYNFVCGCGSSYIGRTTRALSERIAEHLPRWLLQGAKQRPRSSAEPGSAITRHCLHCNAFDRSCL